MDELEQLVNRAWETRQNFTPAIYFYAPGAKHYANRYYQNHPYAFVNLSVTGEGCACRCEHCNGRLLQSMLATSTPAAMRTAVDRIVAQEGRGILVSGGANSFGEVPLLPFAEVLAYARQQGLTVLVHSGLIRRETARALKAAGVDQVLMDIIGDRDTIAQVYHLDQTPEQYLQSMLICREEGLQIAPHVIIGLHFGQIKGEYQALQMIQQAEPETVLLPILTPACGTAMANVSPPPPDETEKVFATARIMFPDTPISLGCARPPGIYKRNVEIRAVDCGVNGIAYPDEHTVEYACSRGLETVFDEACCSLIGRQISLERMAGLG
ncbi:MAG TPA: radical SAM protein [Syntrophomonas sp.]|nr:radical SAM protein [Syntrophomonas sp.]